MSTTLRRVTAPEVIERRGKHRLLVTVCIGLIAGFGLAARAVLPPDQEALPNYDKRANLPVTPPSAGVVQQRNQAMASLKARASGVQISFDAIHGSPRLVSASPGFLTGPGGRGLAAARLAALPADDPHRVAKAFLNEYAGLFSHDARSLDTAQIKRDHVAPDTGLRTVVWQQTVDDIQVFEGLLVVHVTRNGELARILDRFVPDAQQAADAGTPNRRALRQAPPISAREAVARAGTHLGESLTADQITTTSAAQGADNLQSFRSPRLKGEVYAQLVWLPADRGQLQLCWQVLLTSRARRELYLMLVDVQTGEVLLRRSLTAYASNATYRVYTSDSPTPFSPGHPSPSSVQPPEVSRAVLSLTALVPSASPDGWISDGVIETLGNNVDAHLDRDDDDLPDLPRPMGITNRNFNFPLDLTQPPVNYGDAAVVNLFYWNNFMHDKLYELGFTEAAGNFQTSNFGRGGAGNDAVQADAQDGGGYNNANFSTPPDGYPGRMQMYVFDGPTPDRDGDLDSEIILHEYTHGLSNRLLGGGAGISALQTAGMGEGWSDFYALSLLSQATDDPNANYAAGAYASYRFFGLTENYYYGIRRYPYTTDMGKNPLTFKDIDPLQADPHPGIPINPVIGGGSPDEVHNQGEVWCVTLWEARAKLIEKFGFGTGNNLMLQLVTDGLKLAPADATFLEARDAILQADVIRTGGDNRSELWVAFAKRGMGLSASAPPSFTTFGVVEAYDVPDDVTVGVADGVLEVTVNPAPFSALFGGTSVPIFVRVTDGGAVTNATVTASVSTGAGLTFRNDGVAPDLTSGNSIYSGTLSVSPSVESLTITLTITAPGKESATNGVNYFVVPVPSNDRFTNAIKVPVLGTNYVTNNRLATKDAGEPDHAGVLSAGASLWWKFTPTNNATVLIDTAGSSFNTIVAVYTNSALTNLQEVVSADNVGDRAQAFVYLNTLPGVTYQIAVASYDTNSTGTLLLKFAPGGVPDTNAPSLTLSSPLSGLTIGSNRVTFTGTALDPDPNPSGIKEIQIRVNPALTSPTNSEWDGGLQSISTSSIIGSNWSRSVGLFEGLNIIQVAATDFAGNRSATETREVTYRRIDPVNDLFVKAIVLTNVSGLSLVNSLRATKETGELNHAGNLGGRSVWWQYTAPDDGIVTFSTQGGSSFDTLLGLYTGASVDALETIAANDDAFLGSPGGFSRIIQAVRSNQTYHVAVDGFDGVGGTVLLQYSFTTATVYHVTVNSSVGGTALPAATDVQSNATILLAATPNPNFVFDSWSNGLVAIANPLSLVVKSNVTLTALFRAARFTDDFESGGLRQLGWVTNINVPWIVQTNIASAGKFAARSGVITHDQASSLFLTANFHTGTGAFDFKVSSEPGWDFLSFFVDGNLVQQWSGEIGWLNFSFPLTVGTHTLEWRYEKDPNNSTGSDAAFLDNVILPVTAPVQLQLRQLANGTFFVDLIGQSAQQYVLQTSSNLVTWQSIGTNVAVGGFARFVVTANTNELIQFYRGFAP